jgi:hypothetical protein
MLYETETEHPLVQVIEEAGYDDFGFLLFRTDYSSDARWERFVVDWDVLLDKRLDEAGPDTGLQKVAEKVFTKMVDELYVLLPSSSSCLCSNPAPFFRGMTMAD